MTILEEAEKLVGGDRQQDYGDTRKSFAHIAALWSAYKGIEITPRDVGMMMVLLKVSRGADSLKRDTIVDIAGYARCIEMLDEPQNSGAEQMVEDRKPPTRCEECGGIFWGTGPKCFKCTT